MKRQTLACLLGMAIATTGSGLLAQNMTGGAGDSANNSANNASNGGSNGSSMTTGAANNSAPAAPVQRGVTAPQEVNDNGLRISMGGTTAVAGQTQLEGQLVDVDSVARGNVPMMAGSADGAGSAGAAGLQANTIDKNTGTGAINGKGNGMTGSTGTLVPTRQSNTTGNAAGTSIGVASSGSSSSFGTYNHPGATAGVGTSGLQTGIDGSGTSATGAVAVRNGMTPADSATGTGTASVAAGGTGVPAGSSGLVGTSGASSGQANNGQAGSAQANGASGNDATMRQHLTNGVPAAIIANGQTYILACDPRQLAAYAGQDVRVSGQVTASHTVLPTSFEVKNAGGSYQSVTLTRPDQTPGNSGGGRTATER